MEKYKIIRNIFDFVMEHGDEDNKFDAISSVTRDMFENPVYAKKIVSTDKLFESIAVTAQKKDMSDATDADVRIAFMGTHNGRVIVYANELDIRTLHDIYKSISNKKYDDKDVLDEPIFIPRK